MSSLLIGAVLILSSGCFASFNLTRKVYNFNKGVGDKWVNEVVFLVMLIVPVYEVAGAIDVLILNSIEFWTGDNPVSASNEERKIELQEGVTAFVDGAGKLMRITHNDNGQMEEYLFERAEGETVVKSVKGDILVRCTSTDDGGIVLKNAQGKVISMYSNDDLTKFSERLTIQ